MLNIVKYDSKHIKIEGEINEKLSSFLYEWFSYTHESTAYNDKKRYGHVRETFLYKRREHLLPIGCLFTLARILHKNKIDFTIDDELKLNNNREDIEADYEQFLKDDFKNHFTPHNHQKKSIISFLYKKKSFQELATNAGKSFIIYVIACMMVNKGKKVLIITDSVTLTEQLKEDIISYTKHKKKWTKAVAAIHAQSSDSKYDKNKKIIISTYGSMNEDEEYFKQFDVLIIDEGHKAVTKSIATIINHCWDTAEYRMGMTGSLRSTKEHRLQTEVLFGEISSVVTARDLIENNQATDIDIDVCVIERPTKLQRTRFSTYQSYVEFLIKDYKRMDFIVDEAIKLKRNVILLFNRISFGKALYNTVKQRLEHKKKLDKFNVEYIAGDVPVDERLRIKNMFQDNNNVILIASYKTIATGINAPNLRAIMLAEPIKAEITLIQGIGRVLRKCEGKKKAKLIDYVDTYGWGRRHGKARQSIYDNEKHHYKVREVFLKN